MKQSTQNKILKQINRILLYIPLKERIFVRNVKIKEEKDRDTHFSLDPIGIDFQSMTLEVDEKFNGSGAFTKSALVHNLLHLRKELKSPGRYSSFLRDYQKIKKIYGESGINGLLIAYEAIVNNEYRNDPHFNLWFLIFKKLYNEKFKQADLQDPLLKPILAMIYKLLTGEYPKFYDFDVDEKREIKEILKYANPPQRLKCAEKIIEFMRKYLPEFFSESCGSGDSGEGDENQDRDQQGGGNGQNQQQQQQQQQQKQQNSSGDGGSGYDQMEYQQAQEERQKLNRNIQQILGKRIDVQEIERDIQNIEKIRNEEKKFEAMALQKQKDSIYEHLSAEQIYEDMDSLVKINEFYKKSDDLRKIFEYKKRDGGYDPEDIKNLEDVTEIDDMTDFYFQYKQKRSFDDIKVTRCIDRGFPEMLIIIRDQSGSISSEDFENMAIFTGAIMAIAVNEKTDIALIEFSGEATYTEIPHTKIYESIGAATKRIFAGYTNYRPPLEIARDIIKRNKNKKTEILFISDGEPNGEEYMDVVEEIAEMKVKIHGVSVSYEVRELKRLCEKTKGKFIFIDEIKDNELKVLDAIFND